MSNHTDIDELEHPAPLPNPNDFPVGTVFTHASTKGLLVEYVALGGTGKFLRNQGGSRSIRIRTRGFWDPSAVTIVFKPLSAAETLQKARDLIADPAHWTQRTAARDAATTPVPVASPYAKSFCTLGAVDRAAGFDSHGFYDATAFLYQVIGSAESIAQFNDSHTHEEVIALFDAAIEKAAAA